MYGATQMHLYSHPPSRCIRRKERAEATRSTFVWLALVFCARLGEAHFHPVQVFQLFKAEHSALFNRAIQLHLATTPVALLKNHHGLTAL